MSEATTVDDVLLRATRLRRGIPCCTVEAPRVGGSHSVFKVMFEDFVIWAARVNHDPTNWQMDLQAAKKFHYIKAKRPEIQAPAIYIDVDHRILYTEWIDGETLSVWNFQIPVAKRQLFLNNLAEFLLLLWSIPVPQSMAAETDSSYSTWLTKSLDRGLRRTLNKTARWGDAIDYLIMRSMIPSYAANFGEYNSLGFAHGDLNANNILKTADFHLSGVIDWDWMYVAPLPAVVHHPWFLADVPGWNNDGVAPGDDFSNDRRYLEDIIAKKEALYQMSSTVSGLLRSSGGRIFFQSAFHFKSIHERFVQKPCRRTEANVKPAKAQLDVVIRLYPDLTQAAQEVQERLSRPISCTT